jgi:hypothetical protein
MKRRSTSRTPSNVLEWASKTGIHSQSSLVRDVRVCHSFGWPLNVPHKICRFIMFILTLSIMSNIALSRSVSLPSSFLASLSFSIPGSTLYFSQGFSIPGSTLDLQHGFCAIHTVLDKPGFPVKVLPMYLHTIVPICFSDHVCLSHACISPGVLPRLFLWLFLDRSCMYIRQ